MRRNNFNKKRHSVDSCSEIWKVLEKTEENADMTEHRHPEPRRRIVQAPQDLVGGLLTVAVAAAAAWFSRDLPAGALDGMGPGMMPRAVAYLLAALGLLLAAGSFFQRGADLDRWSLRALVFVAAAILAFAYTVRPLGLAIAAPAALLIAACASAETRWGETIAFSLVMTAACIGLFKIALRQPIPLAPWLLGY